MFVFSVSRLLSRRCHNISSIHWAFCVLLCPLLTSVTRWARLAVRSVLNRTRNGSPGVIPATFDARLSDIPRYAQQRIEYFAVCCQLVPSYLSLIRLLFPSGKLGTGYARIFALGFFRVGVTVSPCPRLKARTPQVSSARRALLLQILLQIVGSG